MQTDKCCDTLHKHACLCYLSEHAMRLQHIHGPHDEAFTQYVLDSEFLALPGSSLTFEVSQIESLEVDRQVELLPSLLLRSCKRFDAPLINSLMVMIALICLIYTFNYRNKMSLSIKLVYFNNFQNIYICLLFFQTTYNVNFTALHQFLNRTINSSRSVFVLELSSINSGCPFNLHFIPFFAIVPRIKHCTRRALR